MWPPAQLRRQHSPGWSSAQVSRRHRDLPHDGKATPLDLGPSTQVFFSLQPSAQAFFIRAPLGITFIVFKKNIRKLEILRKEDPLR
jgi:hypothetical protein